MASLVARTKTSGKIGSQIELRSNGISWKGSTVGSDRVFVATCEMKSVAPWSDIGANNAFELVTTAKGGKVYKFSSQTKHERDSWIEAIETLLSV